MSEKPNISKVADTFFRLWQRQVSLLAQSPDTALENLILSGQKIATSLTQDEIALDEERDTTDSP